MTKQYPFFIKATVCLFGVTLFVYCLFNLRDELVPLAFAGIFAILLNPLFVRLQRYKIPRVIAIIITLLIAFIFVTGVLYFLSSQIARFGEVIPELKKKVISMLTSGQNWLHEKYGIANQKPMDMLKDGIQKSQGLLGSTVTTALGTVAVTLLLPVYVFLFLFYKPLILNFLFEVFAEENSKQVADILNQTKSSIQSYMIGLLLEALIVAVLNSTALLLIGVKYAILFGVLGAILNMLPYIGGVIAIILPVLMSLATQDDYSKPLIIIAAYILIQFIDNNILVPRIVSSKVKINALISIVAVLLGNALWGVPGMFLSIPFVAILKIIFDRIDDLKPWGKLLGDEVPTRHKGEIWNKFRKKSSAAEKISKST
ncbi:MAG: AI-2E family transporter [Chitinophagaceae bacterium]